MSRTAAAPTISPRLRVPELRPEAIARDRLMRDLDVAARRPLTVVHAPAGYGKTTALAQWLARSGVAHAWLSLDVHDNDVQRFATHLLAALRRPFGGGFEAAALTLRGGSDIVETVIPLVADGLARRAAPLAIVLDDYHAIGAACCHRVVRALVDAAPPGVAVVVASRTAPPLQLARRRLDGTLSELGREQLRFASEESERLLNGSLALGLERRQLEQVVRRADGWGAGLALIGTALAARRDPAPLLDALAASRERLDAYLVEEVLETARPELRDFLCRTAVLERLNGSLCAAVLDDDRAHERLDEVRRESMFVTALDDDGTWARYHDLFAATLVRELERREPALVPELHLRACAWFERRGKLEEAIEHALRADDGPRAAALLDALWPQLLGDRRHATMRAVLERLPDDRGELGPLCEALDLLCMVNEGVDQRLTWQRADELASRHGGDQRVQRALERVLNSPFSGDVGGAATRGEQAWRRYADDREMQLQLAPQLGMALWMAGAREAALRLLEPRVQLDQPAPARIWILATLAMIAAETGEPDRAEQQARAAMAAAARAGAQTAPELTGVHWVLAEALRCAGRLAEARTHLDRALAAEARRPGSTGDAIAHVLDAQLALAEHDRRRARASALRARRIVDRHRDVGTFAERLAGVERVLAQRVEVAPLGSEPTDAELRVLRMLDGERSLAQIAAELYLSRNTVKAHVRRLYRRLGASSRAEAVAAARERGLLQTGR